MSVPSAPIIGNAPRASPNTLEYRWRTPASDGGSPILGYQFVLTSSNPTITCNIGVANYYKITGLTNAVTYDTTIAASNANGLGPTASFRPFQAGSLPTKGPSSTTIVVSGSSNALLSWTPPISSPDATIFWFTIKSLSTNPSDPTIRITANGLTQSNYFVTGLNPGSTYFFNINAVNCPGYSPPVSTTTITMPPLPPVGAAAFSPSSITGIQVWYDGADPLGTGNAPANGASITTWVDKSGQGRSATASTDANRATFVTTGSDSYLNFNGVNNFYNISSPNFIVNQYYTIFAVERLQANMPAGGFRGIMGGNDSTTNTNLHITYVGSTTMRFALFGNNFNGTVSAFTTASAQPTRIFSFSQQLSNRVMFLYGSTIGSDTNNSLVLSWNGATIGRFPTVTDAFYSGHLKDILIYTGSMTPFDRQKVEGYLAWKWGLQSNLPITHPFYISSPTSASVFSPRSFSGLSIWLDGTDPIATGTAPVNGSTIATWVDKSGAGNNAIAAGTTPTFLTASNAISFGGAGYYNTNYSASLSNESLFFVCRITGASQFHNLVASPSNGGRIILGDTINRQLVGGSRNVTNGTIGPVNSIPSNATFMGELMVTSGTQTSFVNGGSQGTSVAVTYTAGIPTRIGAWDTPPSFFLTGNVNEILGYSTILTTENRQTVEGYLAWKWGLQGSLSLTHPYKYRTPSSNYTTSMIVPDGLAINFTATNYSGSGAWTNLGAYGTSFNATVENGTPSKNAAGNGVVLNGSTNFMFPNVAVGNAWTASMWIKRTGLADVGGCYLTQVWNNSRMNIVLYANIGGATPASDTQVNGSFYTDTIGFKGGTATTLTTNVWCHVTYTWNGSNLVSYSNGTNIGTMTYANTALDGGGVYRIGRRWDPTSFPLYVRAEIGQVLIYNRAITATEVLQNYTATSNVYTV